MTTFEDVKEMICEKEEYTAEEFDCVAADAKAMVNEHYKPVVTELCDAYRRYMAALLTLQDMNACLGQVQDILGWHTPKDYPRRVLLCGVGAVPHLRSGLARGNVQYHMEGLLKVAADENNREE